MRFTVRIRILRAGTTIQLSAYEEITLARIIAKYTKLETKLVNVFQFRIETIDKSVIWIGRGLREETAPN